MGKGESEGAYHVVVLILHVDWGVVAASHVEGMYGLG